MAATTPLSAVGRVRPAVKTAPDKTRCPYGQRIVPTTDFARGAGLVFRQPRIHFGGLSSVGTLPNGIPQRNPQPGIISLDGYVRGPGGFQRRGRRQIAWRSSSWVIVATPCL